MWTLGENMNPPLFPSWRIIVSYMVRANSGPLAEKHQGLIKAACAMLFDTLIADITAASINGLS